MTINTTDDFEIKTSATLFCSVLYFLAILICYFLTRLEIRDYVVYYYIMMTVSLFLISGSMKIVNGKTIIFVIGIFVLGFSFAFRGIIGIDDSAYQRYFFEAGRTSLVPYLLNNKIEKGYLALNYVLYRLCFGDYNLAKLIISYIPFIFFGKAMWKNRNGFSITASALIIWTHYYSLTMGNGLVRLFIAVSICYNALDYLIERERARFAMCIILTALFHASCLFMLFLLLMTINKDWFLKHWKAFTLLMIIIAPAVLIVIARYIVPMLDVRYLRYGEVGTLTISISSFDVLPVLILGVLGIRYIDKEYITRYTVGLVLCFMSILISVISTMVPMSRLIFYGNLGIVIILSGIQKSKSKKLVKYVILGTLIIYSLVYLHVTGLWNARIEPNILPYRPFWN